MTDEARHLHIDALGGLAGDMFLAAALDAAPHVLDEARALGGAVCPGLALELTEARDHGLTGKRLALKLPSSTRGPRHYPDYLALLQAAPTDAGVIARASDILRRLGLAEAKVHGVALERVHFHEISDWDSIVDILLSALVIERLNIGSTSASTLPLGSGRVTTEHGSLPVPAPATLEILKGAHLHDDGVPGERVTPTGAAIFAHLQASAFPPGGRVLESIGYGFGTRDLGPIANALRLSFLRSANDPARETVGVIVFHIDDQTPEDLAVGLSRIRAHEDVIDVQQLTSFGKKNRVNARIEVLCDHDALEDVARACFSETTTIGLRWRTEHRMILPRKDEAIVTPAGTVRAKKCVRPGNRHTLKPEMDDIANAGDHHDRAKLRQTLSADRRK